MSVALPVVAVVFGSVTPPQGDVKELRVHLGCTDEVSSFECLLANFDRKYTVTSPINVGADGSISMGRGANCPLIATIRVEEINCESTPVENYMRVRGRCWGEKLFRRVVTKTYENMEGEAIVKDLVDNYVGLGHVRGSTELIENTDTTYTRLEYENTPVFDILKYIAGSADKAGVIGFDFRVEPDAKFAFFPKNSKTSPINLTELIEQSEYRKDIHRIRNKITVLGAAEKAIPTNKDSWTEDLTKQGSGSTAKLIHADGEWTVGAGNDINVDTSERIVGSKSVKLTVSESNYYGRVFFTFYTGKTIDSNKYPSLTFQLRVPSSYSGAVTIQLWDGAAQIVRRQIQVQNNSEWSLQTFSVGKKAADQWTIDVFNSQPFNWGNIWRIDITCHFSGVGTGSFWVDNLFFDKCRWEATQEDSASQNNYGLRELIEVDEELHSDNECLLRAKALLAHLKDPAEYLTLRSTVIDYGNTPLLPGDKIQVTLPNENIDADYRIKSVEYHLTAAEQTLEITLELGKEQPLLADYLYTLRSKTGSLARTKAGK
jgi:hypothetical protein